MDKLADLDALPLAEIYTRRVGLRWRLFTKHSDGIERPLTHARFWRWTVAARLASAINTELETAAWIALGPENGSG